MDPYQELGVSKGADAGAVKRAYQRRARETHPDKGGDTAKFQRVNAAYRLLDDPARRARYDKTGESGEDVTSEGARLLAIIASLVLGVLSLPDIDVNTTDVVRVVRRRIESDIAGVEANRAELRKRVNRIERALKRVRRRGDGENMLTGILNNEIEKLKHGIVQNDDNIALAHKLLKFLDDYEYLVDPPPQSATFLHITLGS